MYKDFWNKIIKLKILPSIEMNGGDYGMSMREMTGEDSDLRILWHL